MEVLRDNLSIEELEKEIRKNNYVDSGNVSVKTDGVSVCLQDFIDAKDNGCSVILRFTTKTQEDLKVVFGDCTVVCPIVEFSASLNHVLERQYEALITDIDMVNRIVKVSCVAARKEIVTKRESDSQKLYNSIVTRLNENEKVVYPARLVRILHNDNGGAAILSILGLGVVGYIQAKDWAPSYVNSIDSVAKVGEWYDVEIVSKRNSRSHKLYFNCSRVDIATSPWSKENIEDRFKKNDLIAVKCVSVESRSNCWWGVCDDVKGIQLLCDFTEKFPIVIGQTYKCYIKKVDSEKKKFACVPIGLIDDGDSAVSKVIFRNAQRK